MDIKKWINTIFIIATCLAVFPDLNIYKVFPHAENDLLKRIDYTNFFEAISIISLFLMVFVDTSFRQIPKIYKAAGVMLLLFYVTCFFSLEKSISFIEVSKILYMVLVSFTVYQLARIGYLKTIFLILIYSCLLVSILSIYDYFAFNFGLPTISKQAYGVNFTSVFGPFQTTSSYIFSYLLILFPLRLSNAFYMVQDKHDRFLDLTLVLGSIVLLGTGRVSFLIGYALCLLAILLINRNKETLMLFGKILLGVMVFVGACYVFAPNVVDNLVYRFESRVFDRVSGTPEADFIVTNYKDTFTSFFDHPLTGSGLGAFQGHYSTIYPHGTYFRLIGEMGVIGLLGYFILIFVLFQNVMEYVKKSDFKKGRYVFQATLFLIGGSIAWGYNDHLFHKMFWVFLGIFVFNLMLPTKNYICEQKR